MGSSLKPRCPGVLRLREFRELLEAEAGIIIDGLLRFDVEDVGRFDHAFDLLDEELEVVAGGLAFAEDGGEREVVDGADEADGGVLGVGGDGGVEFLSSVLEIGELAGAGPGVAAVERVDAAEISLKEMVVRLLLGPFFEIGGEGLGFLGVAGDGFLVAGLDLLDEGVVEGVGLGGRSGLSDGSSGLSGGLGGGERKNGMTAK